MPLVALGNRVADLLAVDAVPTHWQYVLALLVPALLAGHIAGALRNWSRFRRLLARLGLPHQPDGSLYALSMLTSDRAAVVTLELDDGRKVSGTPRAGPSYAEDDVEELILTHPEWMGADGKWSSEGAGRAVLVPLSKIQVITYGTDPFA